MRINITHWIPRPWPGNCDAFPTCVNSIRPALLALNATANAQDTEAYLPGGHIIKQYYADISLPAATPIRRTVGGLGTGYITFGVDQGGGNEIIVAKLAPSQITSRNVEFMLREILKLRPHPDGGFLFNPDFGLVKIGKKNDDPGGSLIALNPFGRAEPQLDFDTAGLKGLLDALKFGGLLALGFFLFEKTKNEKTPNF